MRNYDAIQTLDPRICKVILKSNQLIPQFNFTIEFEECGALSKNEHDKKKTD